MIYRVEVKEVYSSHRIVEADSPEEAIAKVKGDEGEEVLLEYSHTLDSSLWNVTDESGNLVY